MIMRGDYMKSKQQLPMDPKEAMSYVVANEYDDPRRLVCTARALAAVVCAAFTPEVTDMFLMAIHNEDSQSLPSSFI